MQAKQKRPRLKTQNKKYNYTILYPKLHGPTDFFLFTQNTNSFLQNRYEILGCN